MSHAAPGGPESWRKRALAHKKDERGLRTIRRLVSTAICLALAILFCFVAYNLLRAEHTYIAVLPMDANQEMGYANPNWKGAVGVLKETLESANNTITVEDWNDSDHSSKKALEESVATRIGQWAPGKDDTVIVYVSANSICWKGAPYILYQDYQLDDLATGKKTTSVPVTDLFAQLADCKASCKLLIIDTGRIAYDPRLGVLVNEFPRLIEQKLKECSDEDLYVLLPCSSFESTAGIGSIRPSPFANFLTRALSGEADQDPKNQQLTLAELYSFIWNCSLANFGDAVAYRQKPVLLRGRHGVVQPNDAFVKNLVVVAELPKPAKADEDGSDADPGSDDTAKDKKTETAAQNRLRRRVSAVGLAWMQGPQKKKETEPPPSETESKRLDSETVGDAEGGQSSSDGATTAVAPPKSHSTDANVKTDTHANPGDDTAANTGTTSDAVEGSRPAAWSADLDRLWRMRDALVAADRNFWGPIDVAPHLWRIVDQKLREFESFVLNNDNNVDAKRETTKVLKDLEVLLQYLQGTQDEKVAGLSSRLAKDLESIAGFAQGMKNMAGSAKRLQSQVASGLAAKKSVDFLNRVQRNYNNALYAIVSHHTWLTIAQTGRDSSDSIFDRSGDLAATYQEKFLALRQKLKDLESGRSRSQPGPAAIITLDESVLEDLLDELWDAANEINEQIKADVNQALGHAGLTGEKQRSLLLRTSLLTAQQRRQLNAIETNGPLALTAPENLTPESIELNILAGYENRLEALVQLEIDTIATVVPDAVPDFNDIFMEFPEKNWERYRELGSRLAEWYRSIPDQLRDLERRPTDASRLRRTRELLVILDPRDLKPVLKLDVKLGRDFQLKSRKPQPKLDFNTNRLVVNTSQREPEPCRLKFTAEEVTGPIQFLARFRQEHLKLSYAGRSITPETWIPLQEHDRDEQLVTLDILALKDREDGIPYEGISFQLRTDRAKDAEREVHCRLPLPNDIDLLVLRKGSTNKLGRHGSDVLLLESFPSPPGPEPFASTFKFYLQNQSGVPRTIRAQLIRVPEIKNRTWAPGRFGQGGEIDSKTMAAMFVDGDPALGLRDDIAAENVLAEGELQLSDEVVEQPLLFKPWKGTADAEASAAAAKKGETIDVTHGLLCLLSDASDQKQVWAKWLQLRPLHPREYLEVEARYEDGAIYATTKLIDDIDGDDKHDDVFRWNPDSPGTIQWGDGIPYASYKQSIELKRNFATDRHMEQVELSVDGYPRAFVIKVECRSGGKVDHYRLGEFEQARLHSVTAVFPEGFASPAPPNQTKIFGERLNHRLVFIPCREMRVAFAVDVPTNTFVAGKSAGKSIRLLVDGKVQAGPFYADRIVRTSLLNCEGSISLSTVVTDFEESIPPTALNETLKIVVKLPSNEESATGAVYLDSRPPTIDRATARIPDSVFAGESLRLTLKFEDDGGLGKVQIGIDKAAPFGVLTDADAPQPPIDLREFGTQKTKSFELATDGLTAREDDYQFIVLPTDLAGNPGKPTLFKFQIKKPSPEARRTYVIRGTVVDFRENPIKGSDWILTISGPETEKTLEHGASGEFAKGKFEFLKLPQGKYEVTVVGPGDFGDVGDRKRIVAVSAKTASAKDIRVKLHANRKNFEAMSDN